MEKGGENHRHEYVEARSQLQLLRPRRQKKAKFL